MKLAKKAVSLLIVVMMIVSLFTIVPFTASAATGDTVTVRVSKWVKGSPDELPEGYYSFEDLYTNIIFARVKPDAASGGWDNVVQDDQSRNNQTVDIATVQGKDTFRLDSWSDGNMLGNWEDDPVFGVDGYLFLNASNDQFAHTAVQWYAYTWQEFTLVEHEAAPSTCEQPGNIAYYTAGDRFFKHTGTAYEQIPEDEIALPLADHAWNVDVNAMTWAWTPADAGAFWTLPDVSDVSCVATAQCANCTATKDFTATVAQTAYTAPTAEDAGSVTYTATAEGASVTKTYTLPAVTKRTVKNADELEAAIADENVTAITLGADITPNKQSYNETEIADSESIIITRASHVTIDLAGHSIIGSNKGSSWANTTATRATSFASGLISLHGADVSIVDSVGGGVIRNSYSLNNAVILSNPATLTVNGFHIAGSSNSTGIKMYTAGESHVTVDNMVIDTGNPFSGYVGSANTGSSMTINSGTFTSSNTNTYMLGNSTNSAKQSYGTLMINGGTFIVTSASPKMHGSSFGDSRVIKGGTFYVNNPDQMAYLTAEDRYVKIVPNENADLPGDYYYEIVSTDDGLAATTGFASTKSPYPVTTFGITSGMDAGLLILSATSKDITRTITVKDNLTLNKTNYGGTGGMVDNLIVDVAAGKTVTGSITTKIATVQSVGEGTFSVSVTSSDENTYEVTYDEATKKYTGDIVSEQVAVIVTDADGSVHKFTADTAANAFSSTYAKDGSTIKLLKNVNSTTALYGSYAGTLDLNGFTFKYTGTGNYATNPSNGAKTLSIIDTSENKGGVFDGRLAKTAAISLGSSKTSNANVVIGEGVTVMGCVMVCGKSHLDVYGTLEYNTDSDCPLNCNATYGNAAQVITLHSGAVVRNTVDQAIYKPQDGKLIIEDGVTIIGHTVAIEIRQGELIVEGGTITGETAEAVLIESGTDKGYAGGVSANITGGTFNSPEGTAPIVSTVVSGSANEPVANFVKGNVILSEEIDEDCIAVGYAFVDGPDGTKTLDLAKEAGVSDGETTTQYDSFAEAVAAAADGNTVLMNGDVTLTASVDVDSDITVDLGGNELFYSSAHNGPAIVVKAGKEVTVSNGTIKVQASRSANIASGVEVEDGATLTVDSLTFDAATPIYLNAGGTVIAPADMELDITVAVGYLLQEETEDGVTTYTTAAGAARIGNTTYETFAQADAARTSENDVITLLADYEGTYQLEAGHKLVIEKNGNKFNTPTVAGEYVVKSATEDGVTTYTTAEAVWEVTSGQTVTYATRLQDVTSHPASGTVIRLLKDTSEGRTCIGSYFYRSFNIVIDLDGNTLTSTNSDSDWSALYFHDQVTNGTLTVQNGTIVCKNGAANVFHVRAGQTLNLASDLTVDASSDAVLINGNGATLNTAANITTTSNYGIVGMGNDAGPTTVNITGGKVESADVAIYQPQAGTVNISAGEVTADCAIYAKCGTINISGGNIHADGAAAEYTPNGSGCNPTGDAIVIDSCGYPGGTPSLIVTNSPTITSVNGAGIGDYTNGDNEKPVITTQSTSITLPEGEMWVETATSGVYEIGAIAAQVYDGETKIGDYATFEAAVTAADGTKTIKLLQDVEDPYTLAADETLIVETNGKSLTVNPPEGNYVLLSETENGVTTYTVGTARFSLTVNGTTVNYSTLAEAVDAAPTDGTAATIKPLGAYAVNGFTTKAGQNITMPMNGFRVNLLTPAVITAGSTVTLGSSGMLGVNGTDASVQLINNYGTLNLSGAQILGTVTGKNDSTTNVNTGSIYINLVGEDGATVNIAGNTSQPRFNVLTGTAVTAKSGSTFNITGGDMRVDFNVENGANVAISNGYFKTPVQQAWCADGYVPTIRSALTGTSPYGVVKSADAWAKLVTPDGGEYYYTQYMVGTALNSYSSDGDTLVLLKDHAAKSFSINDADGKHITIDLNNFSLKSMTVWYGDVTVINGTILQDIDLYPQVENSAKVSNLTIGSNCTVQDGIVLWPEDDNNTGTGYNANLTVYGTVNNGIFVSGNLHEGDSVINIENGAVVNDSTGTGIAINGYATVNVKEGATVTGGKTGIEVRAGELNVSGGAITGGTGTPANHANDSGTTTENAGIAISQHDTELPITVNVSDGTITGGSALYIVNPQENTDTTNALRVNISGTPVFDGTTVKDDERVVLTVSGGTFDTPVDPDDCAEGYTPVDNGDGTYGVRQLVFVAEVDGQGYESFDEAVTAAGGNKTIKLLADYDGTYEMTGGQTLIVEKNGFTFDKPTVSGAYVIKSSSEDGVTTYTAAEAVWEVTVGQTVTYATKLQDVTSYPANGTVIKLLKNTGEGRTCIGSYFYRSFNIVIDLDGHTLTSTNSDSSWSALYFHDQVNNGTLTVQNGTIVCKNGAANVFHVRAGQTLNLASNLTVDASSDAVLINGSGATLNTAANITTTDNYGIVGLGDDAGPTTVNITGGKVESADVAIYQPQAGTVNISAGEVTADCAIYAKCGTINISGGNIHADGAAAEYTPNGSGCNPTGDAIVIDSCGYPGGTPSLIVTNSPTITSVNGAGIGDYTYGDNEKPFITSETTDITLPAGEMWVETETPGVYEIGEIVAQVYDGDTKIGDYATFDAAVTAANGTKTIKLLKDYDGTYQMSPGQTLIVEKNSCAFNKPTVSGAYIVKSDTTDGVTTYTVETALIEYTSLAGAVSYKTNLDYTNISASGTYKLLDDVTAASRVVPGIFASNVTFDLNGHTLTLNDTEYGFVFGRNGSEGSENTYAIIDSSQEKGGKVVGTANPHSAVCVYGKYSNLTIEDVTIEGCVAILGENECLDVINSTIDGKDDYAIATNGSSTKDTFIGLDGATLTSTEIAMYLPGDAQVIIDNSEISGATAIYQRSGVLAIDGSTVTGTNGDAIKIESCGYPGGTPIMEISSGSITATNGFGVNDVVTEGNENPGVASLITNITLPEGEMWVMSEVQGVYEIGEIFAQVYDGDTKIGDYATFEAAVTAADGTKTIKLLKDYDETYEMTVGETLIVDKNGCKFNKPTIDGEYVVTSTNSGTVYTYTTAAAVWKVKMGDKEVYTNSIQSYLSNPTAGMEATLLKDTSIGRTCIGAVLTRTVDITIDLGGHTLTSTNSDPGWSAIYFHTGVKDGTLTVQNGTIVCKNGAANVFHVRAGQTLNLEDDLIIDAYSDAVLIEGSGATLNTAADITTTGNYGIVGMGNDAGPTTVNITGGKVESADVAIYQPQAGTVNISDGEVTADCAIYAKCGTINISGGNIHADGAAAEYTPNGSGCNPTGDAIVIDSCGYPGGTPSLFVTNSPTITSVNGAGIGDYTCGDNEKPVITSETTDITLPAGEMWVETETPGVYEIGEVAAEIYEDDELIGSYVSFDAAHNAVQEGQYIKLCKDVEDEVTIAADEVLKVMLNGKTITVKAPAGFTLKTETEGDITIYSTDLDFSSIIYKANLTLEENIAINFYIENIPASTDRSLYSVEYTFKDDTTTASLAPSGTSAYLVAECAAKEMTEGVDITVSYNGTPIKEIENYSIRTYCENKIMSADSGDELKDVCYALLSYGSGAQEYFDYNTEDLADANYHQGTYTDEVPETYRAVVEGTCDAAISANLSLESETKLKFYFKAKKNASIASFTFEDANGNDMTASENVEIKELENGYTEIIVNNIAAKELNQAYVLSVTDGSNNTKTITYSPLSYAYNKQNSETMGTVAKQFYHYWDMAKAYFDSKETQNP